MFLATKFGIVLDPVNPMARAVNGRPEYVRASCDASLQRLGPFARACKQVERGQAPFQRIKLAHIAFLLVD